MNAPLAAETRLDRVMRLRAQIADKLDEISKLYKDRVKCTLVVRAVDHPDGKRDTVMTDDEPQRAIDALKRLITDPNSEHHYGGH